MIYRPSFLIEHAVTAYFHFLVQYAPLINVALLTGIFTLLLVKAHKEGVIL